jgi:hypothetical protein
MNSIKYFYGILAIAAVTACEKETAGDDVLPANATKEQLQSGLGGSMSQFTIMGDYLYTIDYKTLNVFHLADPSNPVELENIDMGVGMETIFQNGNYIYIGATDGVHIFDISNPREPVEVSEFEHVTSCDPVIANDEIAIATLRGGTQCGGSLTELDIIDLSDINYPKLKYTTELINPYGLGFSKQNPNIVYVCDGYAGLKAYDISNDHDPELVMEIEDMEAMDVISTSGNLLIVLTRGGVYQYDASNPIALTELSHIAVQ